MYKRVEVRTTAATQSTEEAFASLFKEDPSFRILLTKYYKLERKGNSMATQRIGKPQTKRHFGQQLKEVKIRMMRKIS